MPDWLYMVIFESAGHRWWEIDSPTVRLYHGTSSVLLPIIQEQGLQPPGSLCSMSSHVLSLLEEMLPRARWTPELLDRIESSVVSPRRDDSPTGVRGSVLYFFVEKEGCDTYARSYAQWGGELAKGVWDAACLALAPELSLKELRTSPPLPPRWAHARPVTLELDVPREHLLWHREPASLVEQLRRNWEARTEDPSSSLCRYASLEDMLNSAFRRQEVRCPHAISPSCIREIHQIARETLAFRPGRDSARRRQAPPRTRSPFACTL